MTQLLEITAKCATFQNRRSQCYALWFCAVLAAKKGENYENARFDMLTNGFCENSGSGLLSESGFAGGNETLDFAC